MAAPGARPTRSLPSLALALALALLAAIVVFSLPTVAGAMSALPRPVPKILSASWGTDGAVGCPSGEQGLDNIPVTFNWFVRRASIQPTDFRIVRSDGSVVTPTARCSSRPTSATRRRR